VRRANKARGKGGGGGTSVAAASQLWDSYGFKDDEVDELAVDLAEEEEDLRIATQSLLHEAMAERAANAFALFETVDRSAVGPALKAASHVLGELTTIVKEVAPCVPDDYAVVMLARNLYQSHLLGSLEALYRSTPTPLRIP
jgi:hypothetical protein